ncbi:hypothetical protein BBF96_14640 [Anoxybacter fermentans]|uniref:HepT-like domain-containing protein n=1 Tax=Anoxybacter fermentans TaxID=1323375 RepID=A0A3Q9HSW5_9FIRM|nr:hypothetical protein [Anoxybacter fermentans]AZR74514.1 hypothetical protein BBF96_14640 [Anoxybacter fermentans]
MSLEKVISSIMFEIKQIDQLFESYKTLLNHCKENKPDLIELTALASVLHSFYNGIENIFLQIAKKIDCFVPQGKQWHRDLLLQMTKELEGRQRVISDELKLKLVEYLGFRHFYRHSYSFFLRWDELEKLVYPLTEVWIQLKSELNIFLDRLSEDS